MKTTSSTRFGILLGLAFVAALGSGGVAKAGEASFSVRDHRTPAPIVRDHRMPAPVVRDHRAADPIVRDHREPIEVRDHRGSGGAAQGGVMVTSSDRRRGSTRCIRSVFGGPCVGLGWRLAF